MKKNRRFANPAICRSRKKICKLTLLNTIRIIGGNVHKSASRRTRCSGPRSGAAASIRRPPLLSAVPRRVFSCHIAPHFHRAFSAQSISTEHFLKLGLAFSSGICYSILARKINHQYPGVAQLVARLTGGQEAVSSSLATRTKKVTILTDIWLKSLLFLYIR